MATRSMAVAHMDLDNYRLRSGRVRDRVRVRDKDR